MGKKKNGQARKRGAPDHFTGFKLAFLIAREDAYQHASDSKTVTAFYNKVTADFVAKFGQEEPFNKEPAEDPPDPEDLCDDDELDDGQLKEEADENAKLFAKLRTVSAGL